MLLCGGAGGKGEHIQHRLNAPFQPAPGSAEAHPSLGALATYVKNTQCRGRKEDEKKKILDGIKGEKGVESILGKCKQN